MPVPKVNQDECNACAMCAGECPTEAITVDEFPIFDEEKCSACAACVEACPSEALSME